MVVLVDVSSVIVCVSCGGRGARVGKVCDGYLGVFGKGRCLESLLEIS